jgi:hypothetical protein
MAGLYLVPDRLTLIDNCRRENLFSVLGLRLLECKVVGASSAEAVLTRPEASKLIDLLCGSASCHSLEVSCLLDRVVCRRDRAWRFLPRDFI